MSAAGTRTPAPFPKGTALRFKGRSRPGFLPGDIGYVTAIRRPRGSQFTYSEVLMVSGGVIFAVNDPTSENDAAVFVMLGPYTLRWRDDLGNDTPGETIGEHLSHQAVSTWLASHLDVGTFEIIDEGDQREACGHDFGFANAGAPCRCCRRLCPDCPDFNEAPP